MAEREGGGRITNHQCETIAGEFYSAYTISALFLSDESVVIIDKIRPVLSHHADPYPDPDTSGYYKRLEEAREELIASARRDLG